MKVNWTYIKLMALLALVAFLFGFARQRHAQRDFSSVEVQFGKGENRFVTVGDIKSSLQELNGDSLQKVAVVKSNLRKLERHLKTNRLIENAEVFIGINGRLKAEITQGRPIARAVGASGYYLDAKGESMPLSPHFSARVTLIENATEDQVLALYPVMMEIDGDDFLSTLVTSVSFKGKHNLELTLRDMPLTINFGKIENTRKKFNNLKAFYKKMKKSGNLENYKEINLNFENQVVATKK